jgi:uncharacterized membrane protein
MKKIMRKLLAGLATILPVVITAYVLYWLATSAEKLLGGAIRLTLPEGWYWPGMGIAAGIVLIFVVGLLMQAWIVKSLVAWGERVVLRIPFIKTVYGAVRDLMGFVTQGRDPALRQVVAVKIGDENLKLIGFVTREDLTDFPGAIGGQDMIAVYLPMSYQLGGYTVIVPRSAVQPVDMSLEEATRFVLTGGVTAGPSAPQGATSKGTKKGRGQGNFDES